MSMTYPNMETDDFITPHLSSTDTVKDVQMTSENIFVLTHEGKLIGWGLCIS